MATPNFPVTGVAVAGTPSVPVSPVWPRLIAAGQVPVRQEIRTLQSAYPDQWNLYLLGLNALQGLNEEQLLSYYQIAGIHGMPYKPWNGVDGIPDVDEGYCTHSSVLFAPWHRPYLALFEMALYNAVQSVAAKFPTALRAKYVAAAQVFRIPYWDWAITASPIFPTLISSPTASVVWTDGTTKTIQNPLYSYKFNPMNPSSGDFDDNWSQFQQTVRYPSSTTTSRDNLVTSAMKNDNASLRKNVALILTDPGYKNFDAFSNNEWRASAPPGTFGSLEDIHNEIHDKTGGNSGHMSSLDVSAFDPVFWLHHANVDRLFAIWQALNPMQYVTPQQSEGNFTTEPGATETATSPLKPFWNASGTAFWTSNGVQDTTKFGYAYPETQKWAFPTAAAYEAAVKGYVNAWYVQGAASVPTPTPMAVPAPPTVSPSIAAAVAAAENPTAVPGSDDPLTLHLSRRSVASGSQIPHPEPTTTSLLVAPGVIATVPLPKTTPAAAVVTHTPSTAAASAVDAHGHGDNGDHGDGDHGDGDHNDGNRGDGHGDNGGDGHGDGHGPPAASLPINKNAGAPFHGAAPTPAAPSPAAPVPRTIPTPTTTATPAAPTSTTTVTPAGPSPAAPVTPAAPTSTTTATSPVPTSAAAVTPTPPPQNGSTTGPPVAPTSAAGPPAGPPADTTQTSATPTSTAAVTPAPTSTTTTATPPAPTSAAAVPPAPTSTTTTATPATSTAAPVTSTAAPATSTDASAPATFATPVVIAPLTVAPSSPPETITLSQPLTIQVTQTTPLGKILAPNVVNPAPGVLVPVSNQDPAALASAPQDRPSGMVLNSGTSAAPTSTTTTKPAPNIGDVINQGINIAGAATTGAVGAAAGAGAAVGAAEAAQVAEGVALAALLAADTAAPTRLAPATAAPAVPSSTAAATPAPQAVPVAPSGTVLTPSPSPSAAPPVEPATAEHAALNLGIHRDAVVHAPHSAQPSAAPAAGAPETPAAAVTGDTPKDALASGETEKGVPTGEPATKDEPVPGAPAAKDEHAAAPASEGPAPRDEPKGTTAANAEATPTRETTAATGVAVAPAAAAPSGKSPSTEWITNVRVKKHTLDQTFRVLVFLGEPAAGTSGPNLVFAPELVGRVTVLGRGHTNATCARCNVRRDIVVSGTVPLTEDLRAAVAAGGLASLGAADVLPYLREKLCWRVTLFDGSETPAGTVDGLVVSVVSTAVEEVEGELPVYSGVYETHPEATAGKPAGHTAEVAPA